MPIALAPQVLQAPVDRGRLLVMPSGQARLLEGAVAPVRQRMGAVGGGTLVVPFLTLGCHADLLLARRGRQRS